MTNFHIIGLVLSAKNKNIKIKLTAAIPKKTYEAYVKLGLSL